MPNSSVPEDLSSKQYVTVVLRLLINSYGHLVYGEVLDAEGRWRGRFATWNAMIEIIRSIGKS